MSYGTIGLILLVIIIFVISRYKKLKRKIRKKVELGNEIIKAQHYIHQVSSNPWIVAINSNAPSMFPSDKKDYKNLVFKSYLGNDEKLFVYYDFEKGSLDDQGWKFKYSSSTSDDFSKISKSDKSYELFEAIRLADEMRNKEASPYRILGISYSNEL
jgi:hypothetical protein